MAEVLVPFTFPVTDFSDEQEVIVLKQRDVVLDGYAVTVCYSKADYDVYLLNSLQVHSSYTPFLPFNVVCKAGRAFLGERHLSYVEFFKNNKKVYCWTTKERDGRVMPPDKSSSPEEYEGFGYSVLKQGVVDLF